MNLPNRVMACHHIELQDGCRWCDIYKHQSVRECDRCKGRVNSDMVFLSLIKVKPELICIYCHHDEKHWGR